MKLSKQNLRCGYTTGTSATAAVIAAYRVLIGMPNMATVKVTLPATKQLDIPVRILTHDVNYAVAEVVKDAGDDPDITDKIAIQARIESIDRLTAANSDYLIPCGQGTIIIGVDSGIGTVTRPGLDAEVGKWAINSVPRQMIVDNLAACGFGQQKGLLQVKLTAVNGGELAPRTLNAMLGVIGGISILGTTGIVVPYSHRAYIKTIAILLRSLAAVGKREVMFSTGNRTRMAIMRDCPHLAENQAIRIGDFIADALAAAEENQMQILHLACMPGKLYKYACGHRYTHAHTVALTMDLLLRELALLTTSAATLQMVAKCHSISEVAVLLDKAVYEQLLAVFMQQALINLRKWNSFTQIKLYIYNIRGELLLCSDEQTVNLR